MAFFKKYRGPILTFQTKMCLLNKFILVLCVTSLLYGCAGRVNREYHEFEGIEYTCLFGGSSGAGGDTLEDYIYISKPTVLEDSVLYRFNSYYVNMHPGVSILYILNKIVEGADWGNSDIKMIIYSEKGFQVKRYE